MGNVQLFGLSDGQRQNDAAAAAVVRRLGPVARGQGQGRRERRLRELAAGVVAGQEARRRATWARASLWAGRPTDRALPDRCRRFTAAGRCGSTLLR